MDEESYYGRSELQAAFEVSMSEMKPDDTAEIFLLTTSGRWVVVHEFPVYCPRTDALMGTRKVVLGHLASRVLAMDFMGEYQEDVTVYPPQNS